MTAKWIMLALVLLVTGLVLASHLSKREQLRAAGEHAFKSAELAPIPQSASSVDFEADQSLLHCGTTVTFVDQPASVQQWVRASKGIAKLNPAPESDDENVVYRFKRQAEGREVEVGVFVDLYLGKVVVSVDGDRDDCEAGHF